VLRPKDDGPLHSCLGLSRIDYTADGDWPGILKASATGGRQVGGHFRDLLMTGQIAAALVLLIGAGLLLRSFLLLRAIDPGYQRHNLLAAGRRCTA
jgi:hypothetical protein